MLHEIIGEETLPAKEIRAFDVLSGIIQHFIHAVDGNDPGLQDQPLKWLRQADGDLLRILLCQLHHTIHLRAESSAVRDDEHALLMIRLQLGEDAGIGAGRFATNHCPFVKLLIQL